MLLFFHAAREAAQPEKPSNHGVTKA